MRIAVVNETTLDPALTPMTLSEICAALSVQMYAHYAPFWESAGVDIIAANSLDSAPPDASLMVLLDNADQAGVLGYHDVTPDGRAYARVFLGPILASGGSLLTGPNSLSVTMSHEALEMVGDPYAVWWSDGPDGNSYALELCDAVEGDSYDIDGVSVSNFVGPRFFRQGPGPYDWMRRLEQSFQMTAGGYQIVRTSAGDVHQIWGAAYPEWKRLAKLHPVARTARRSRPAA